MNGVHKCCAPRVRLRAPREWNNDSAQLKPPRDCFWNNFMNNEWTDKRLHSTARTHDWLCSIAADDDVRARKKVLKTLRLGRCEMTPPSNLYTRGGCKCRRVFFCKTYALRSTRRRSPPGRRSDLWSTCRRWDTDRGSPRRCPAGCFGRRCSAARHCEFLLGLKQRHENVK